MIAVDTNVLVHAHRIDSPFHSVARRAIAELAEGHHGWALPWPCVHEFLAIVTHPRVWVPPTPVKKALEQVEHWMDSPSVVLLRESDGYWEALQAMILGGQIVGPKVHDARIAALCQDNGVRELWTADRDFSRFPSLRTRNPLVD